MSATHLLRQCRLVLSISTLLCAAVFAQTPVFTSPLPTGVRLDPVGDVVELGSLPINLVIAPGGDKAVVVLSGWREQGVQVVELKTRKVTQTLLQDGAFYGAAFSPDGHHLYVSGGNTDMLFVYAWKDGAATLENKFVLATAKTADGPLTASTTPPIAGPTRKPTLAIVLIATFADVSSSGVVASDGSNAACAGGKAVETIETKTASA